MDILNATFQPEEFFRTLGAAPLRVLMLDYDGTLAPFVEDRTKAFPHPGIRELLERIRSDLRNRLVIVSGRAVEDILPILGMDPPPEIWGSHGYEHRLADGQYLRREAPRASYAALEEALGRAVISMLSNRLEIKPLSIAVHWRGEDRRDADELERVARSVWQPALDTGAVELYEFDGGLELRIPGRTKGDAVRDIVEANGPDAVYAYFGDDATDEDAFDALAGTGLTVLVRPEPRETLADVRIEAPQELLEWLSRWAE